MKLLAPGKVNLCLYLGPLRADGRHELVTLFESVSLADQLVVSESDVDEVVCPGVEGPNLVADALAALRAHGWESPPVRIEILKQIPVAAGMGGGSADAAAVLRSSGLPHELLLKIAASLGADVPSQLSPGLELGTGAGEIVEPAPPLEPHAFVIVPADFGLSTADVYREADRLGLARPSLDGLRERVLDGDLEIVNDLEAAALSLAPQIAETLDAVRATGADHAFVCGSGPTVAGSFWGADQAVAAAGAAADRIPGAIVAAPVGPEFAAPSAA
jgi:4-diphosphocytidyl-2-C-methyl-D-erythritol kinase